MGKKGKARKNRNIAIVAVAVAILAIVYGLMGTPGLNIGGKGDNETDGGSGSAGGAGCRIVPTVNSATRNALNQGTTVTVTENFRVDGTYRGTTAPTFAEDEKVQVMYNASSFINVISDVVEVDCGANDMTLDGKESILMFAYSAPSIEIKDGATVLTDEVAGGANNATAIVAGGSDTYEICFTGVDESSSGNLEYVIELGSNANVSTITMVNDAGKAVSGSTSGVPGFYVDTLTSPYTKSFDIPAVVGAVEQCYKATVAVKSGKTVGGGVYTTAYVKEAFVEDDGTFLVGVENEDGDIKYEATFDEDFYITR